MISNKFIENYLDCKYKAYLKSNNEVGLKKEFDILNDKKSLKCKNNVNERLLEKYGKSKLMEGFTFGIEKNISKVDVLIKPTVYTENFQFDFDAMEIEKSNEKKSYIPILVTSKETCSKRNKLSIAIRCVIVSQLYGIEFEFGRVIYGSGNKTLRFKIKPFLTDAKKKLNELNEIVTRKYEPLLFYKKHCIICEYQEICKKKLIETDGLGLLQRMDEKNIKKLNSNGIFTVKQLSYTFKPRKKSKRMKQHPYYFSLQALAIEQRKVYLYDRMDLPNVTTKVFIDMEGNSNGSFIYLIGILIVKGEECTRYTLWADSPNDENKIFDRFLKILEGLDDFHIFHYGSYESRVFKRMMKVYSSINHKILSNERITNILKVIYLNIYFPTYSNGLKDIGNYLGCRWSSPSASGVQSLVWREKWEQSKENKLKDLLISYNYDDCIALRKVVDFVYEVFNKYASKETDLLESNNGSVERIQFETKSDSSNFGDFSAVSKDFEVINQCAYFEYQRNKIFFRKNKRIKKNIKTRKKQARIKYKPNKTIEIKSCICPNCGSNDIIHNEEKTYSRICFDLKFLTYGLKRWITIYQMPVHFCSNCNIEFMVKKFKDLHLYARRGKVQKKYEKQTGWGHNLLAWVVYQNVVNRVTFRNIENTLKYFYGLPLDNRRIWDIKNCAAEYYESTYNLLLKNISNSDFIHVDETKIKLKNEKGYIWVFTTMEEVLYLYRPTRETGFLHDLLKDFKGVLITDFYPGYDSLDCLQQKCLIHLVRDLNDVLLKNPFDDELKEIVSMFGRLVRNIVETIDKFGLNSRYLKKHKKEVKRFYHWLYTNLFNSDSAEKIKKRLVRYENKLFLFLDYDNVPWNNNNAERAVKQIAKSRQQYKGKVTKNGLRIQLILLSIFLTCEYKGINFLDFLVSKEKNVDEYIRNINPM